MVYSCYLFSPQQPESDAVYRHLKQEQIYRLLTPSSLIIGHSPSALHGANMNLFSGEMPVGLFLHTYIYICKNNL